MYQENNHYMPVMCKGVDMDSKIKVRLSLYGILSTITYIYLILTPNPGISVPVFIIIQFVSVFFIVKNKKEVKNNKGILIMIPIFVLSLNRFISANNMWQTTNFFVIVFLYSVMFLMFNENFNLKNLNIANIFKIILNMFVPFFHFIVPFKWVAEKSKNKEKNLLIKRVLIGLFISIPCVLFLIIILSSADLIFYKNVISFNTWIAKMLNFFYIFKFIIGSLVGLYLFGHLYSVFVENDNDITELNYENSNSVKQINGDVIILNILLGSVLIIYSMFIIIQFKYLFSSGELPYDLNYSEYARRGFFELVFLSILNIALILLTTFLLKEKIYVEKSKWGQLTKLLLIYLCILTGVLLISSFYRMSLYDGVYGFTRLRILVYLFLIFEGFGLLATLIYIIQHNFNILAIYVVISLVYYLSINIVQIDTIIAKRNIDMYFNGQTETIDVNYLMSLSIDAAPQIMRLIDKDVEIITKSKAISYFIGIKEKYSNLEYNWQSYNLSVEKAKRLLEANKDKLQPYS
ncbi:DUF4153 domain-containing protein [Sedimentibacter sp. MB31-C6]|uniref:DUF4153 domain-containing protein n=1 Tax=Sedimentibacter sp. MB31-C6 TaxID=3109366 RepID=UPI002DDDA277|nr:DUF4173 domain-containing protein [Sedimentibacter sp. MB36-C1]WSI02937.1 DUF4173 domain-containing protein [Sedimentibacter sp. MB36-C1]